MTYSGLQSLYCGYRLCRQWGVDKDGVKWFIEKTEKQHACEYLGRLYTVLLFTQSSHSPSQLLIGGCKTLVWLQTSPIWILEGLHHSQDIIIADWSGEITQTSVASIPGYALWPWLENGCSL